MPQNVYLEIFLLTYLCPPHSLFQNFFAVVAKSLLFGIFFLLLCCTHTFLFIYKRIYLSTFWYITINMKKCLYNNKKNFPAPYENGSFPGGKERVKLHHTVLRSPIGFTSRTRPYTSTSIITINLCSRYFFFAIVMLLAAPNYCLVFSSSFPSEIDCQ